MQARLLGGAEPYFIPAIKDGLSTSEMARFITAEQQPEVKAYWGRMHALGTLGGLVSAFRVQFHDGIAHKLHRHPRHDEIVVVVAGAIEQTIGEQTQRLAIGEAAVIPRGVNHKALPLVSDTEVIVVLFGEGTEYETEELVE